MELIRRARQTGGLAIYRRASQAGVFYCIFRTPRRRSDAALSTHLTLEQAIQKRDSAEGR